MFCDTRCWVFCMSKMLVSKTEARSSGSVLYRTQVAYRKQFARHWMFSSRQRYNKSSLCAVWDSSWRSLLVGLRLEDSVFRARHTEDRSRPTVPTLVQETYVCSRWCQTWIWGCKSMPMQSSSFLFLRNNVPAVTKAITAEFPRLTNLLIFRHDQFVPQIVPSTSIWRHRLPNDQALL